MKLNKSEEPIAKIIDKFTPVNVNYESKAWNLEVNLDKVSKIPNR